MNLHRAIQPPLIDAHCHVANEAPDIAWQVVNGTCEEDWPAIDTMAATRPGAIVPSYGLHPWYLRAASPGWLERLDRRLRLTPRAAVGEIGIDRACPHAALSGQSDALRAQLALAARHNRPASIHCVRAWGLLADTLESTATPPCGILLHAFNGPAELVERLSAPGACFSICPSRLPSPDDRAADLLARIPRDRLLVETDTQKNKPAPSLADAHHQLARLLRLDPGELARLAAGNFHRLFAPCLGGQTIRLTDQS